jgi:DNA adenine methylase
MWYGGKGNMVAKLLPLVPEHRTYVEPFCGAASLFFAKAKAEVETLNDLHGEIANLFRVLRDEPEEFLRLARLSEYGRELWRECRAAFTDPDKAEPDRVRRAWRWWYVAATSFCGNWGSSLGTVVTSSTRGMAETCSKFRSRVRDVLPQCIERLREVQIENSDALTVVERYCTEDGFCYADPPYVMGTRDGGAVYAHECSDNFHTRLVAALLVAPGAVLLSGYAHPIYDPLEAAGWERRDFDTACYAAARTRATGIQGAGVALAKQARVESVWLNPCLQERLRAGELPLEVSA